MQLSRLFLRRRRSGPISGRRYHRSPEVVGASHGDRTVLMDLRSAQYFALDAVGGAVWELLDEPRTVEDLARLVNQRFDAPEDQVLADVAEFLGGLVQSGLVREAA